MCINSVSVISVYAAFNYKLFSFCCFCTGCSRLGWIPIGLPKNKEDLLSAIPKGSSLGIANAIFYGQVLLETGI